MNDFHHHAPEINYVQNDVNNVCFSSLAYAMFYVREYVTEQDIVSQLKSSLSCDYFCYKYSIRFDINIMSNDWGTASS